MKAILAIGVFAFIIFILSHGLGSDPTRVPSPLIGQPAPRFQLPLLFNPQTITRTEDFKGHVTLLNIWASWCSACANEHELLVQVSKNSQFELIGLDYKDDPEDAKKWLDEHGNPYKRVALDQQGLTAIDWGVYGTPETYVIDKHGIIRFKQIGSISPEIWDQIFTPLLATLENEP